MNQNGDKTRIKAAMRVGRGEGSGKGKTAGRGMKVNVLVLQLPIGFEGGQMPLHRRLHHDKVQQYPC